jgi:hypothetical protein
VIHWSCSRSVANKKTDSFLKKKKSRSKVFTNILFRPLKIVLCRRQFCVKVSVSY